jgi:hypothetical protein
MKKIKAYDIETTIARFELTIYEKLDGSGFVGEYFGTTPKFAQVIPPGGKVPIMKDIGDGKVTDSSFEQVEKNCREEIEKLSGKILRSIELKI